jgi:uncharacterized protein (TIGR03437 family)
MSVGTKSVAGSQLPGVSRPLAPGSWPLILAALALVAASMPAEAYYHYVHYLNGNFGTPVYEKFDLTALPNKTITFLVQDTGPQNYGANDDFASVLSQIQQAAIAWNSVGSSDLRVAFGGLESAGQPANGPGGDVVFVDLPPGLLGLGGTNVPPSETPVNDANGRPFFPITRSIIQLTDDTSEAPGPSYLESFFTTAVHEMGHALGLQHTWTSAAMAQDVIRNTSRARPLDADDRAGLSVLYGKSGWTANFGSISGRVTANGQGVALASVVAIPPSGPAVSALTNPDGTYTINGLPASNVTYLLYVHPLPPDAILPNNFGLKLPVDQNGVVQPASGPFATIFLPDPSNGQQPKSFSPNPGSAFTGQNFSVNPQSAVSIYDLVTYSYSTSQACAASATPNCWNTPAYVNSTAPRFTVETRANQPLVTPVPQSVTILGGFGNATLCAAQNATLPCFLPYNVNTGQRLPPTTTDPNAALAIYFSGSLAVGTGPRHLVFTMPSGDLYILPDGVNLVSQGPPVISSVTANGDGTVTVAGAGFLPDSRVFFDGQPVVAQSALSGNAAQGSITVTPPLGYSNQNANVIVFNSDGQNSTFYQAQTPPTYSYPASGTPQVTLNPASLRSGVSSLVDVTANNMQFCSTTSGGNCLTGLVTLGLGTPDISVRRVWVLSPTHLVANVVVAPGAAIGSSEASVLSGFQTASQPGGFQIQPADPTLPFLAMPLENADPFQQIFYPGAVVSIYGQRLAIALNSTQVTLNGQSVQVLYSSANQVNFVIPPGFPTGLAVLNLNNGSVNAPPVELEIDNVPPAIQQIIGASGQPLDASHFASSGDTLVATVSNVDPSVAGNPGGVQVTIAGIQQAVVQVNAGAQKGTVTVSFVVSQSFSGATVSVAVAVGGVTSSPSSIIVK